MRKIFTLKSSLAALATFAVVATSATPANAYTDGKFENSDFTGKVVGTLFDMDGNLGTYLQQCGPGATFTVNSNGELVLSKFYDLVNVRFKIVDGAKLQLVFEDNATLQRCTAETGETVNLGTVCPYTKWYEVLTPYDGWYRMPYISFGGTNIIYDGEIKMDSDTGLISVEFNPSESSNKYLQFQRRTYNSYSNEALKDYRNTYRNITLYVYPSNGTMVAKEGNSTNRTDISVSVGESMDDPGVLDFGVKNWYIGNGKSLGWICYAYLDDNGYLNTSEDDYGIWGTIDKATKSVTVYPQSVNTITNFQVKAYPQLVDGRPAYRKLDSYADGTAHETENYVVCGTDWRSFSGKYYDLGIVNNGDNAWHRTNNGGTFDPVVNAAITLDPYIYLCLYNNSYTTISQSNLTFDYTPEFDIQVNSPYFSFKPEGLVYEDGVAVACKGGLNAGITIDALPTVVKRIELYAIPGKHTNVGTVQPANATFLCELPLTNEWYKSSTYLELDGDLADGYYQVSLEEMNKLEASVFVKVIYGFDNQPSGFLKAPAAVESSYHALTVVNDAVVTGVDEIADENANVKVAAVAGGIEVSDFNGTVNVYSAAGANVYNGQAGFISLGNGVYIVKAGSKTFKLNVN